MKQGWEIKKLGDICTIKGRIGFRGYTRNDLVEEGEGAITLSPSNIVNDVINFDKCQYISWYKYDESPEIQIFEGDVIYAKTASIGKVAIIKHLPEKATINPQFVVFKDIKCNHDFLYYAVRGNGFKEQVSLIINGVAIPTISQSNMAKLTIPVPPIAEQEKIVAELDCLSWIIEKKKQQLKELDNLAQSIFYEMFGDPDNSRFPKLPLQNLSEYKLSYGSGASAVEFDEDVRYIRITDIQEDGKLDSNAMSPSVYEEKYLLHDGDILFARSGATVGKTYHYRNTDGKAIYAGYLIRFIPNQKLVLPEYVFYYTRSDYYHAFIRKSAQAVAQPNINAKQYGDLIVCVPPLALQQEFASKIEAIEKQKELIAQSIKETETLFNSRMDYYFN